MSEYKSCHLLEHGICFYIGNVTSCCYAFYEEDKDCPVIYPWPDYKGENINKTYLYSLINNRRENAEKNGRYIKSCETCYHLKNLEWSEENYIDNVYITHFEACNCNCIYCINQLDYGIRKSKTYKIVPILDKMIQDGILKQGCEFHIGGGEFTIYPECDEIIEKYVLSGFTKFLAIATNGIKFSKSIFNAMDLGKACIIISVDSGSRNMYKKIKRTDSFNQLKNNLKLYTSTENSRKNTFLKYIVLPDINDSKFEFWKFLRLAKQYGIIGIKIDVDGRYLREKNIKLNKKIAEFLKWTVKYAEKKGFEVETFSFYNQYLTSV